MTTESQFHAMAGAVLMHCHDQLEDAYDRGELEELTLEEGVLTIETAEGKQFIVSRHTPSQQIWLASPLSGGLHFSHTGRDWVDRAGKQLYDVLRHDLKQCKVEVVL